MVRNLVVSKGAETTFHIPWGTGVSTKHAARMGKMPDGLCRSVKLFPRSSDARRSRQRWGQARGTPVWPWVTGALLTGKRSGNKVVAFRRLYL